MKKLILCIVAIAGLLAFTPADINLYITHTAHVSFFSKARLENIEAHNYQGQSLINIKTGDVAFSIQMKSFEFKKQLMQDHFNERYLETDKYPKATFKGKINNIASINLATKGTYNAEVEGDMTMHGETKHMKTNANIVSDGSSLTATATFPVTLADYKVSIPEAKADNIAPVMDIKVEATFKPKE